MNNNKCLIAYSPAGSSGWLCSEVIRRMDMDLEYAFLLFLIRQGAIPQCISARAGYSQFADLITGDDNWDSEPERQGKNLPQDPVSKFDLRVFAALNGYYTIYWITGRGELYYTYQSTYSLYLRREGSYGPVQVYQYRGTAPFKNMYVNAILTLEQEAEYAEQLEEYFSKPDKCPDRVSDSFAASLMEKGIIRTEDLVWLPEFFRITKSSTDYQLSRKPPSRKGACHYGK